MKLAQLLHNPGAGEEGHSKKELIALIEETLDVECRYFSTKEKDWKHIEPGIDLLVIAVEAGLGLNAAQTTLSALAQLTGARVR